jgi:site-specific DNA recombinase
MGRLLLQMLAMFAQFERDTISDRVVAGMERKAARGHWMGGRRPFGYRVDKPNHRLITDKREAAVVKLIFDLYVKKRLGTRAVAAVLNERGHRTTVGGAWSGHQVNRTLSNRVYFGELTFRDTTVTGTHDAIIDQAVFDQAETILTARGEDHSHRASNASDYHLTGRLRCPSCGEAMIGTAATGRSRSYRYYTCFARGRYGNHTCTAPRLDAVAADAAVLAAMARFYRDRHDLIGRGRRRCPRCAPGRLQRPARRTGYRRSRTGPHQPEDRPLPDHVRGRRHRPEPPQGAAVHPRRADQATTSAPRRTHR